MARGTVIEIRTYDARWPREFERVRAELTAALPRGVLAIHHVGSTSVPGLAAKPILDVLVGVPSFSPALRELRPALEGLGFTYRPDDDLPDRHYFPRTVAGLRRHHLSLAEPASRHYRNTLVFRDALRDDPALARRYEALKRHLAATVGTDRLAYLDGKTAFVHEVLDAYGGDVGRSARPH
ncbi:MAG: GrpB family protein [Longimicrobiales bacterium]